MRTTILFRTASTLTFVAAALTLSACAGHTTKDTKASTQTTTATQTQATAKSETAAPAQAQVSCTKSPDTRVLKIEAVTPKGCRLQYTRYGHTGPVAWSYVGNSYCESVRTKIVSKLEKAGYKCGDEAAAKTAETTNTDVKKD